MSKVIVKINPKKGEAKYEVDGVQGGACTDITKALTEANEVMDYQYTEEFGETEELPDYCEEMADSLEEASDEQ